MLRALPLDWSVMFAAAAVLVAASAMAQTCDTLLGASNCAAPGSSSGVPNSSDRSSATRFSNRSLGMDLSSGGDNPGFFAGITISGGGVKCSGLFRSRDCLSR